MNRPIDYFSGWLEEYWFHLLIGAALVAMAVALVWGGHYENSESYQRPAYQAWLRLNPGSDISFADWNLLRQRHLLPGQPPEPTRIVVHTEP